MKNRKICCHWMRNFYCTCNLWLALSLPYRTLRIIMASEMTLPILHSKLTFYYKALLCCHNIFHIVFPVQWGGAEKLSAWPIRDFKRNYNVWSFGQILEIVSVWKLFNTPLYIVYLIFLSTLTSAFPSCTWVSQYHLYYW